MSKQFIDECDRKIAQHQAEIARWQTAKACAQQVGHAPVRVAERKTGSAAVKTRRAPKRPNAPGALVAFARQHDDASKKASDLARQLLPLAKREGLKVTVGSLAGAFRRHREGLDPTITEMEAYIRQFGPMPFDAIRGWLEETHPEVKNGRHHPTLVRLNVLKQAGRIINQNGAFKAVEATH